VSKRDLIQTIFGEPRKGVDLVKLWNIIDGFPSEESAVFHALYDQDGNRTAIPLTQVAESLGLTSARARTVQGRALRNLRHPQRVKQYSTFKQYSHRNGETESPTEAGWYWFLFDDSPIDYLEIVCVGDRYCRRMYAYDDEVMNKLQGRWWGPVTPPWVTNA
jgi:hypothetical protein